MRSYSILVMKITIPDISKQIYSKNTLNVLENQFSTLGPIWAIHQMEWINGIYASFKDHDKFLIIIFLIKKTLDFYSRNFIKLSFDEFYSKDTIEIEEFSIKEISKVLRIPKESTRRKVLELENDEVIRRFKKKIIIDRSKFHYSKPVESIIRISRFLAKYSEMCVDENVLKKKVSSKELEIIIKNNFSYIWKLYFEIQIPMLVNYKKIFNDLETFHIFGTCVVNQFIIIKKLLKDPMNRDDFLKNVYKNNEIQGLNAMSISDITGIPRATVFRKLNKLLKEKFLIIDDKKHYKFVMGFHKNQLLEIQEITLNNLSILASSAYNFVLIK